MVRYLQYMSPKRQRKLLHEMAHGCLLDVAGEEDLGRGTRFGLDVFDSKDQ